MMKTLRYTLAFLILPLILLPASAEAAPAVVDAWIPEAPPVSTVMAAFMTIRNPDADDVKIVSVQSEKFSEIQMHLSIDEDGVAKMLPQKALIIPAHGELQLRPGSYHLMLFNPVAPLKAGDKVTLNFTFADGSKLPVVADVKKAAGMKAKRESMPMKCGGSGKCY